MGSVSDVLDSEMKIAKKKSKSTKISVQQTTDGEQPTKSAANQHGIREVICNALLINNGFSRSKKLKTSDQLIAMQCW